MKKRIDSPTDDMKKHYDKMNPLLWGDWTRSSSHRAETRRETTFQRKMQKTSLRQHERTIMKKVIWSRMA